MEESSSSAKTIVPVMYLGEFVTKYVRLSDKSDFKSESDRKKFDLARKLKKKLGEIKISLNITCNNDALFLY